MGAWEASAFDNDDAADFIAEFDEAPTVAFIRAPLGNIANAVRDDYVEAPECSQAIAAAALIKPEKAQLARAWRSHFPASARIWN